MNKDDILKEKRQYFHKLLIALGEVKYKEIIVEGNCGVTSTTDLNEKQLDKLISEAKQRLSKGNKKVQPYKAKVQPEEKQLRMWRNKCLLVMNQRNIKATPKDWTAVNTELAKKQYQWVLSPKQIEKGIINRKGLYAFQSLEDLKKLFKQLCSIRDNEKDRNEHLKNLANKN